MRWWQGTAAWTLLGLAVGLWPRSSAELRCSFLSVGHGCAVLIEAPNGRTLLYDAGSFADGGRAADTIRHALWRSGRHQIDAVVISHADIDHYNGLRTLIDAVPVHTICFAVTFLDFSQRPVAELCDAAAARGVPLRIVQAGDRLLLDPSLLIEVLHPARDFDDTEDNADSVVLRVEYAGRSCLLTGDIEGAGLTKLLSGTPRRADIMLSPHHGSRAANPASLYGWCRPDYAIASTGDPRVLERLRSEGPASVTWLSTANQGLVSFKVSAEGQLDMEVTHGAVPNALAPHP
ncbi:MAG: MBL fold metallo-hydrolase [Planctomycetaceae bacterium]